MRLKRPQTHKERYLAAHPGGGGLIRGTNPKSRGKETPISEKKKKKTPDPPLREGSEVKI